MGFNSIEVGDRVHVEGEFGTILYIGPINNIEGNWLGVEWDNPLRGKHSGSYNDVTYFTTKIPNAGSFIKISKADLGISFPEALKLKYGHENVSIIPNIINLPQNSGPERHIEMIGMKKIMGKQSKFSNLTDVALSNMLVSSSGSPNVLREITPNIRELDLSQNLLNSWKVVNEIVEQLTELKSLILSKNCLRIPECPEYQECYESLKTLVLNDMSYSWEQILKCAVMWPYIEELSIQYNKISVIQSPSDPVFSKLRCLSLDNNSIENWMEICKLGTLLSLHELHLDNIGLKFIAFPDVLPLTKTGLFSNLEILFLRNNQLKKWEDIGELNKLNKLTNLMINNNPVFSSENPKTARQFVIAKILCLKKLNRMEIDNSERRGAEYDYVKMFYKNWLTNASCKNENDSSSFLKLHPTYPALLQKHGAPEENEVRVISALIKDSLISVQFISPLLPDKPPIIKKLPGDMTISKIKALVKRLFKVPTQEIKLNLICYQDESKKTELNNLKQLSYYSVSDKDQISVEW